MMHGALFRRIAQTFLDQAEVEAYSLGFLHGRRDFSHGGEV
jgi:hypothetical protein